MSIPVNYFFRYKILSIGKNEFSTMTVTLNPVNTITKGYCIETRISSPFNNIHLMIQPNHKGDFQLELI